MEKQYTISRKKVDGLYKMVAEEIMNTRIKCKMLIQEGKMKSWEDIDNILYESHRDTPEKAIEMFLKRKK